MKTKKLLFYSLAALLGGCVPVMSLHPLYTEKDVLFEEKLLGSWVNDPNNPTTTWEFKRPDESKKVYQLICLDKEDKKGLFDVYLVKLESKFFLDLHPGQLPCGQIDDPEKVEWLYNVFFLVPAHTFIKIDSIEPQLRMRLTDDDDMKKLLAEDPNVVKYELADDKLILTASTRELQAFVLKYADDSRVFSNEIVLSRKKPQDPNDPNTIDPNYIDPDNTDPNEVSKIE